MNVAKTDTFSGHRDSVYTLEASTALNQFYSAGGDGYVVAWDVQKPDLGTLLAKLPSTIYSMAFEPSEGVLWVGQNQEGIQLIDPSQKEPIGSFGITKSAIFAIVFWGATAYVGLGDGVIVVIDIPTRAIKKHLKVAQKSVRSLAVSPALGVLVAGTSDHTFVVLDLATHSLIKRIEAHLNSVFSVCFSPDSRWLLTTGRDARINVWDTHEGYRLQESIPAHLYAINHLAFSPDGRYWASGSMDKSIKIWDTETFRLRKVIDRARHAGHGTSVNSLLWLPDTPYLLSASDDRMVSIWKLTEK